MAVLGELQKDGLDEYQQPKHNFLSSFRQTILGIEEPKKYAVLLTFVLLINTVIIIVVASNKTPNKGQPLPDYLSDISDDQPRIELDDSTTETSHMNNEQRHYTSSEPADEAMTTPDENNQAQTDD